MKAVRKPLSVLLAITMLLSCISVAFSVFATNATSTQLNDIVGAFSAGNYSVRNAVVSASTNNVTFTEVAKDDSKGIPSGSVWAAVKAFGDAANAMKVTTAPSPSGSDNVFNVSADEINSYTIWTKLKSQLEGLVGASEFDKMGFNTNLWRYLIGNPNYTALNSTTGPGAYASGMLYFPTANGSLLPNAQTGNPGTAATTSTVTVNRTIAMALEGRTLADMPSTVYTQSSVSYTHTLRSKTYSVSGGGTSTSSTTYYVPYHYITAMSVNANAGTAVATDAANLKAYQAALDSIKTMAAAGLRNQPIETLQALADALCGADRNGGYRAMRTAWNNMTITNAVRVSLGMDSDAAADVLIRQLLFFVDDVASYQAAIERFQGADGFLFLNYDGYDFTQTQTLFAQANVDYMYLNNLRNPEFGMSEQLQYCVDEFGLEFDAIDGWMDALTFHIQTWELRAFVPYFEAAVLEDFETYGPSDLLAFWRDFTINYNKVFGSVGAIENYTTAAKTDVFGDLLTEGTLWYKVNDVKIRLDALDVSEESYEMYMYFMSLNLDAASIPTMDKATLINAINTHKVNYQKYCNLSQAARNAMFTAEELALVEAFMEGLYQQAVLRTNAGLRGTLDAWHLYGDRVTQMNYKALRNVLSVNQPSDWNVSSAAFAHIDAQDYYLVLRADAANGGFYAPSAVGNDLDEWLRSLYVATSDLAANYIAFVNNRGLLTKEADGTYSSNGTYGHYQSEIDYTESIYRDGDLVRIEGSGFQYVVTEDKLDTVIAKLDAFLGGPKFMQLLADLGLDINDLLGISSEETAQIFSAVSAADSVSASATAAEESGGGLVLPNINTAFSASLGKMITRQSPNRPAGLKTQHFIQANKADVLISLLRWIFKAIDDPAFITSIMDLIGGGDDEPVTPPDPTPCCTCPECICVLGESCNPACPCTCGDCNRPPAPAPEPCCDCDNCKCEVGKECKSYCKCGCDDCHPVTAKKCCDNPACICVPGKDCDATCTCGEATCVPPTTGATGGLGDVLKGAFSGFLSEGLINDVVAALYPMLEEEFEGAVGDLASLASLVGITPANLSLWFYPRDLAGKINAAKYPLVYNKLYAANQSWDSIIVDGKIDLDWGLNTSSPTYADDWLDALGNAVMGIVMVLKCSLANRSHSWSGGVPLLAPASESISPNRGYLKAAIPLLEGLGIDDSKIKDVTVFESNYGGTDTSYSQGVGMIKDMLGPVFEWLFEELPKAPISTLCKILPNVSWMMETGLLKKGILEALNTTATIKVSGLASVDENLPVAELLDVDSILGGLGIADINSLSGVLNTVVGLIMGGDDEGGGSGSAPLEGTAKDIIDGITADPDQTICALIELLVPQEYPVTPVQYTKPAVTEVAEGADVPANTVVYSEIWTKNHARYLNTHIDDFLMKTVELLLGKSFSQLITDLLGESAYTNANVEKIVELLRGILDDLGDTLDMLAPLLNVDLADLAYNAKYYPNCIKPVADFVDGDKDGFINALVSLLDPVIPVLEFLLNSRDLEIIPGITVNGQSDSVIRAIGYDGYTNAIIPLLEGLGCEGVKSTAAFQAEAAADTRSILVNILEPIFGLLDKLIAAPTQTLLAIAPNVLYLLQGGILSQCVTNLLHPIYVLLDVVRPIYDVNLSELLGGLVEGVDLNPANLNLMAILGQLLASLGLNLPPLDDILDSIMVGTWESYTDANGEIAYRMVVGDNADMLTQLLRTVVNVLVYPNNTDGAKALIAEWGILDDKNLAIVNGLLDMFQKMSVDTVLYVLFYLIYGVDTAVNTVNDKIAEANKWLKEVSSYISDNAQSSSFKYVAGVAKELMNKYFKDIVDPNGGGVAPNGLIAFFQAILNFFKRLFGIQ